MKKIFPILIVIGIVLMGASFSNIDENQLSYEEGIGDYKFDKDGNLIRPEGYRKWIYIGTPITPNDKNPPEAAFPDFHNVYIHPGDFAHYEETGKFRDGTILIKELVQVGSTKAVSGNGYFMGDFIGLEATIKDSKRFPNEPGNWSYFSFGHSYPLAETAKAFPTAACNSCHQSSAADDFVFTQYYPVLSAAKGGDGKMRSGAQGAITPKQINTDGMKAAMSEQFADKTVPPTEKDMLLTWLNGMHYKGWYSEKGIHQSFGPHDDVKVFYNGTLATSMETGNKNHPIGSTSVKEQYKDGKHYGWSVAVKKEEESEGGDGWYWFETLDRTDKEKIVFSKIGEQACTGCHNRPGNKDLILSGYPLN